MKKILILTLLLLLPGNAFAKKNKQDTGLARGDGKIRLYNYHLQEFAEFDFRGADDKAIIDVLLKINQFLRSRDNNQKTSTDIRLINLVDHLQDHFQVDTIEIISGYRSPEFNEKLKAEGHKVAKESLHIQGKALDIHIDEIREESLRDYLISLKQGGVGYYGPLDFVHVDTGKNRTWEEPNTLSRKLIGVLDPKADIQLTSDKNEYLPDETLYFSWDFANGAQAQQIQGVKLERFFRGKWMACPASTAPKNGIGLPSASLACSLPEASSNFGKFRWVFKMAGKDTLLSSNEFYLKKL